MRSKIGVVKRREREREREMNPSKEKPVESLETDELDQLNSVEC
jgi:hypothetical protein